VERWRAALSILGEGAAQLSWRYAAFELDPNVPPEGVDARVYLAGKYPADMVAAMHGRLTRIAGEEGLPIRDFGEQSVRPNTFDGHRLLAAALHDGVTRQQALADELFAAHWVRGENVGLPDVLATAATAAGMPREWAEGVLGGEDFAAAVRAEERLASDLGIHAVPTFVVADRLMVSGAQPPSVLADTVREALGID
jgi:predicted DsbA family dithiol-disulfide isomerase